MPLKQQVEMKSGGSKIQTAEMSFQGVKVHLRDAVKNSAAVLLH